MEDKGSKKTTFQIFIIVLGIFLVVFIGVWLYNLYSSTRVSSTALSKSAIECTSYSFDVDITTIVYSDSTLSFIISNLFGDKFDDLAVKSDEGDEREAKLRNFVQGNSDVVRIEGITITETFEVYPKGCEGNKKTYRI